MEIKETQPNIFFVKSSSNLSDIQQEQSIVYKQIQNLTNNLLQ